MADPKTELLEAKRAAQEAMTILQQAQSELKSARGWGIFDLIGGGMIASFAKRSRMNAMRNTLEILDASLGTLSDELQDVPLHTPARPDDSFTAQLLDIGFDNVFTDLYVQGELNETGRQLDRLEETLTQMLRELDEALAGWDDLS